MSKLENIIHGKAVAVIPKKGTAREEYTWDRTEDGFKVYLPDGEFLQLVKQDGWTMVGKLNGKNFKGTRPTIELAFKATDQLLFTQRKELWCKMDCGIVLIEFQGELDGIDKEPSIN